MKNSDRKPGGIEMCFQITKSSVEARQSLCFLALVMAGLIVICLVIAFDGAKLHRWIAILSSIIFSALAVLAFIQARLELLKLEAKARQAGNLYHHETLARQSDQFNHILERAEAAH